LSLADDCRSARRLWSFYASKQLKQPFVLWLDDVILIAEKKKAKKPQRCSPDPFWIDFPERLRAAWDELEKEP